MALPKYLEDLLAQIQDEKDREATRQMLEKYEPLRNGLLVKEEYDSYKEKTAKELEAEKTARGEAEAFSKRWDEWQKTNVPRFDEMVEKVDSLTSEKEAWQREKELLVKQAAEHATFNMEEGEVDANKLMAIMEPIFAQRGYISKADAEKMIRTEATKLAHDEAEKIANERIEAERDTFLKTTYPMQTRFNSAVSTLQMRHFKEFNDVLDPQALFQYMADNKIDDPAKAYDQMQAPKRQEVEIDKRVQAKLKEELAKLPLPGTSAPASPELGPLQMFRTKQTTHIPEDAEPGSNQLSSLAAQELRAEGKW